MSREYTTLISAADLAQQRRPDWVVLDCRHDLANPQAGRGGNAGRGAAGRGAQPPSFPQAALQRATVAGRPLSSLPADAYKW